MSFDKMSREEQAELNEWLDGEDCVPPSPDDLTDEEVQQLLDEQAAGDCDEGDGYGRDEPHDEYFD